MPPLPPDSPSQQNILQVLGDFRADKEMTVLQLQDGRTLRIDTHLLDLELTNAPASSSRDSTVIPLVEEQLVVGRRTVETGKVRLQKTVQEYDETLNEPLAVRTYDIERVVLNQPVDAPPPVRQEGDVTIYPLVEEQLILTKQLIVREEVRVTRRDTVRTDTQVVTLKREHLVVEREALDRK